MPLPDLSPPLLSGFNVPRIRRTIQQLRWHMRSVFGAYPSYLTLTRYRHPERAIRPDTTLVIEGFPRSGNTFAEMAFRMAQPKPVKLAHHLHVPAQVITGVRYNIPVLLLIRPPDDAVLSFSIKTGGAVSLRLALRYYIRFYAALLAYRSDIVAVPFHDVVTDFGAVIGRLNTRYGTAFTPFAHTEKNVKECFARIDQCFRDAEGTVRPESVGRPTIWRQSTKADLRRALYAPALKPLRLHAQHLYAAYDGSHPED